MVLPVCQAYKNDDYQWRDCAFHVVLLRSVSAKSAQAGLTGVKVLGPAFTATQYAYDLFLGVPMKRRLECLVGKRLWTPRGTMDMSAGFNSESLS